ncbi:MAG: hypothetical protein J6V54_02440 [Bacteroidales bacterium]|nr:hypothetical protein [Bacteroidales bacterium]
MIVQCRYSIKSCNGIVIYAVIVYVFINFFSKLIVADILPPLKNITCVPLPKKLPWFELITPWFDTPKCHSFHPKVWHFLSLNRRVMKWELPAFAMPL